MLRVALELAEELDDDAATEPVALLFAGRAALYLGDDQATYRTLPRGGRPGACERRAQHRDADPSPPCHHGALGRAAGPRARPTRGKAFSSPARSASTIWSRSSSCCWRSSRPYADREDECRSLAAESRELAVRSPARDRPRARALGAWRCWSWGSVGQRRRSRRCREISSTLVVFWVWPRSDRSCDSRRRTGNRARLAGCPRAMGGEQRAAWGRAVALHCRALLSDDERESERLFLAALDAHAEAARPFEHARTELAYGEFLRRARRRVEARDHLRAALDGFETLGATLWAERARVELRASGQTARKRDPSTRNTLTEQELQIARFVARGPHEPRSGSAALPQPADDRLPPTQRLPEARHHLAHRARPPRSRL